MPEEWYSALWSSNHQWNLLLPAVIALSLTTFIGLEREASAKSAGVRTHALVGVGSSVFMLVSKYGFADLMGQSLISLDPSRVAAQIVSGIGFIGAGLIFVRQNAVRGLTTAATIWLAAAVGTACGAGLPTLALAATVAHFVIARGLVPVARAAQRRHREVPILHIRYLDGRGILRGVLQHCTSAGFAVGQVTVEREINAEGDVKLAAVALQLSGRGDVVELAEEIAEMSGVQQATGDSIERV